LGYKDKDWSKIKVNFIQDTYYNSRIVALEDGNPRISPTSLHFFSSADDVVEEILYDRLGDKVGKEFIGLDHPDRSPNRKLGFGEKALSIKS